MTKVIKEKREHLKRRALRVRAKVKGTKNRPRLSVYRSLKHIYAALIDDEHGHTLAASSDLNIPKTPRIKTKLNAGQTKTKIAYEVGKMIAERAKELGITSIVFDRGGRKYHGRIKALAEGAREGGLKF